MKTLTTILAIVLTLSMMASFTGCGPLREEKEINYAAMTESFVESSLNTFELYVGEEHAATATVWLKGASGGSAWTSDSSVVTVNEFGKVTAVGAGSAYVVITADKRGSMFEVYRYDVFEKAPEADLSNIPVIDGIDFAAEIAQFSESPLNTRELKVGNTTTANAAVWAQNGGQCFTSDASVVTVSANGTVTAVGRGTAYVIVTAGFGNMFEITKYIVK